MSLLLPTPLPVVSVRRPLVRTVVVSLVAMGGILAVLEFMRMQLGTAPSYVPMLIAVAFAAWYGGSRPALASALAGYAAANVWLFSPSRWASPEALAYGAATLAIIFFASSFRRQLRQVSDQVVETEAKAQRATLNEMNLRAITRRLEEQNRETATELARLGGRLRSNEDRIRVAQESAGFCLFDWGHPGDEIIVFGDPYPVFGVTAEQWNGKVTLLECIHPEDRETTATTIDASLRSRFPLQLEVKVGEGERQPRWVAIRGKTSYGKNGEPARTIGIFLDVTEKKLTEQALVRTEKLAAAGRLAAAIAHEVNNPLAAATNLMFIIKGDATLSRSGRQYVEMAEQELARLGRIAKQTLGFYRERSTPCKADIGGLLDGVLEMYARNLPAGIKVKKLYSAGAEAEVIEGEIRQVFSNILMNAVQAIGDEGIVHVKVEPTMRGGIKGWVTTVKDTGPGIPHYDLQSLFEPFFTRKGGGTGLGLWIAKQIVERHGGSIEVDSCTQVDGHGTKVSIYLPSTQPREESAQSSVA